MPLFLDGVACQVVALLGPFAGGFTKFADVRCSSSIAFDLWTLFPPPSEQYATAMMFTGVVQNIQEEAVVVLSYTSGT